MNKQLQIAIGKLIGKDYFKLEFGCEVIRGTEPNEPDKVIIGQYYEVNVLKDIINTIKNRA